MKKYSILIKEYDERTEEIEANSYDEACNKIEDLINEGKMVLDPYNYSRRYENVISKTIEKGTQIDAHLDTETNTLIVTVNGKTTTIPYCYTVRNLKEDFAEFCDYYLENNEIEIPQNKEIEQEMEAEM